MSRWSINHFSGRKSRNVSSNYHQLKLLGRNTMKNLKKQISLFVMLMITAFIPSCRAQVATDGQQTQTNLARDGVVISIRSMTAKRAAHSATLLDNGKVLIAG